MVVLGQDTSDDVLVDIKTEQLCYLLRDLWAAIPWISTFHFNNSQDEFLGWSLGTRLAFFA